MPETPINRRTGNAGSKAPPRLVPTDSGASPTTALGDSVERLDRSAAAEKAERIAEIIRRRRDTGFYHRTEVLHAVTQRLLESGDLERVELPG
jgi:hypothetical protein